MMECATFFCYSFLILLSSFFFGTYEVNVILLGVLLSSYLRRLGGMLHWGLVIILLKVHFYSLSYDNLKYAKGFETKNLSKFIVFDMR
jgi:hypothetical protein